MSLDAAARLAIHELLSRAAYGYDERDTEMLGDCFAGNAAMTMRIAGGDVIGPFEGREAIMGLMTGAMAEQNDVRRHVISNVFFLRESADSAEVVSNLTLLATENGAIQLVSAGVYRDRVQHDGTRWRIAERHLDLDRAY
ncbi:MAG: nuclear transport factor 2 family protein [Pseudomonadales bacterium]